MYKRQGYRYYNSFNVATAYPFGYGLSYTQFSTNNLKLSTPVFTDKIQATVTVTNTGTVAGKEVVQLYLSAPMTKLDKPKSELKAFAKTKLLQPGESQEISFSLTAAELASFNTALGAWVADGGDYTVQIGNAQHTIASANFKLAKEIVVEKVNKILVPTMAINELKREMPKTKK